MAPSLSLTVAHAVPTAAASPPMRWYRIKLSACSRGCSRSDLECIHSKVVHRRARSAPWAVSESAEGTARAQRGTTLDQCAVGSFVVCDG